MTDIASDGDLQAGPAAWGEPRSKLVQWYDPQVALSAAARLSGLDYTREIAAGRLPPPPIASVIDLRLVSVEEGRIEFGSTPDESLLNAVGLVHGGVLCTMMDTAMGIAVQTTLGPGLAAASIELKVSFLKPLPYDGREVRLVGEVLKPGRRVAFAEAHAYTPDGTLIGHGTSSLAVVGGA